jgi:PmbA protein
MTSDLLELAKKVVAEARAAGADEVAASVSRSVQTSLSRRDGKVEQATEATSRGLAFSVLVDGKFSSHSTSDLRPDALSAFIKAGIAATRYLEQDLERALPDAALCGRKVAAEALDQWDPAYEARTAEDRARDAEVLERDVLARKPEGTISAAVHVSDGSGDTARATSNGFADVHRDAWFMGGAEVTLQDGDRRPEASTYYGTRYLSELPSSADIADDLVARARERLGSGPTDSGSYPLILPNRAAGRILGLLSGPLAGSSLHEGRSCLAGKLGQRIANPILTIVDDPWLPRGLASRPWDGDGLFAVPRDIVRDGVLESYYISVYYGRKLGVPPTTGGRSNWIVTPGKVPWTELVKRYPKAILVDGFLGGNSNATTGDFSMGIRGALYENGVRTKSLSEMNVAGNLLAMFDRLVAVGDDPWTWSSTVSPTLIFEDVQFSGN